MLILTLTLTLTLWLAVVGGGWVGVIKVDMVLSPIASYNVDILHSRSAEITAAHK